MGFWNSILFRRSRKIHEFFTNAIRVYTLRGEEDARCAALAAAKRATPRQRNLMVKELSKMASSLLRTYHHGDHRKTLADRLFPLIDIIKSNGSGATGEDEEKLSKLNREYLSCLHELDSTIFYRKYPELF